jgi:hypothetical protein
MVYHIKKLTVIAGLRGICLFIMVALAGCSETCTPDASIGRYNMKTAAGTYDLNLSQGGSGSISRNGQKEAITWEWDNGQVFLHLSRDLIDDLGNLIGHPTPPNVAHFRSGYFGMDPKCRKGHAIELALGDREVRFSRID